MGAFDDLIPQDTAKAPAAGAFDDLIPSGGGRELGGDFADLIPPAARDTASRGYQAEVRKSEQPPIDRPARMTLTRGGQPVLEANREPTFTREAPWSAVAESLPAQLVAGAESVGANLREMLSKNAIAYLKTEIEAKDADPEMKAYNEAVIAAAEGRLPEKIAASQKAREIAASVTPPDMTTTQKGLSSFVQSAPSTLAAVVTGVLTRSPQAAMAVGGAGGFVQQAAQTYGEAIVKGATHEVARRAGLIQGAVELFDAVPIGIAMKAGSPFLKRLGATIITEPLTEGGQQALQDLDAYVEYDPNMTLGEAWENVKIAMIAGAIGAHVYTAAGHAMQASQTNAALGQVAKDIEATDVTRGTREEAVARLRPERAQMVAVEKSTPVEISTPSAAEQQAVAPQPPVQAEPPVEPAAAAPAEAAQAAPSSPPAAEAVAEEVAAPARAVEVVEQPADQVESYPTKSDAIRAASQQSREFRLPFKAAPHPTEEGAWTVEQVVRSEAQQAADQRTAVRARARLKPDESRDTITTFIAKMGGLRLDEAPDITGERTALRAPNHPMLFLIRRKGGMGVDQMGEFLHEAGYFTERPDEQEIRDAIAAELDGSPHYSYHGTEAQGQARQRDQELQHEAVTFAEEAGVPELEQVSTSEQVADHHNFVPAPESQITGDRLALMQLTERAVDANADAVERASIQFEGNDAEYAAALQEIIDANEQDVAGRDGRVGEKEQPFSLAGETESERQAREVGERDRGAREERENAERDSRDRADREREGFGLTGSERPADLNPDQGNLYSIEDGRNRRNAGALAQPEDVATTLAGGRPAEGWIGATRISRNGRPRALYRGAKRELSAGSFAQDRLGFASGNSSSGLGVWFTPSEAEAATFGPVSPYYLDIRNPKVIKIADLPGFDSVEEANAFREKLRAEGYDGIVVNIKYLGGISHVVAFDAQTVMPAVAQRAQIKAEHYNLRYSKTIQRTTESESRPRMNVAVELKRALRHFDVANNGTELATDIESLIARIKDHKEPRFRERVRGTEWLKERLIRARRLGELSEQAVDLALWMLEKNPNIATDLGISLKGAAGHAAGQYNPAARIITLAKESDNADTAAHEILHHTERMMPEAVREGIVGEWLRQMSAAYRNATPEQKKTMRDIVGAAAGEPTAKKALREAIENGTFPYELYQYTNPSEFWAVNGARILSARHGAEQSGWVAKARQWLSELIEKLKGLVGLKSDAPVIRALNEIMNYAEGQFVQQKMLANENQFLSPEGVLYSVGPTPQNQATPQTQQAYVVSASRALRQAQASPPANTWEADAGLMKRLLVTPRTIAAFEKDFVPVYQTAVEQWKFRDQLIAKFERLSEPYFKAPKTDQDIVNKVLEHDRLTGQVSLAGQNTTVHFTAPEAALSRPGERLTVTAEQKTAYWAVRNMLNEALNEFRDQTLEDFGLPRGLTANQVRTLAAAATTQQESLRLGAVADTLQGIEDARRTGYVPFSRYGEVGISVRNALTGVILHYETIEVGMLQKKGGKQLAQIPEVKARLAALRAKYPSQTISEPFQVPKAGMPAQVKLEEVDALAEMAKIDNATWDSVRTKLEQAVAAKGFRAHFFRSKNIPGYSADFERGLANYVNGISGYLARRRYASQWVEAIAPISQNKARLRQYAQDYQKYVNSPAEEFGFLRAVNFVYYLTSVATWITNLTQVPFVSMPWMTQFANPVAITGAFTRAEAETANMLTLSKGVQLYSASKAPADVRQAVQQAYDQGLFIPITTYESMGIARNQGRRLRNLSKGAQTAVELFGLGFTMAERQNRIATFIALYRMARDNPQVKANFERVMAGNAMGRDLMNHWSPEAFAEFGIDETHFKSGKVNRPTIARNAGTVVFQFKMFMWNMLERVVTMTALQGAEGRAAAALMLMVLGMISGLWGLPGAENLRDLWELWMKKVKNRDVNADAEMRKLLLELGASARTAQAVSGGATRALPEPWNIDLSKRIGMGKILPSEPGEMLGVSYDLWWKRPMQAMEQYEVDNYLLALAELMPKQAADIMTQLSWSQSGVRSKASDQPVIPKEKVTEGMRVAKGIGFTPGNVANIREAERAEQVAKSAANEARNDFYRRMAKVVAEEERATKSGDAVAGAKADMEELVIWAEIDKWNKANPEDYLQVKLDRKSARRNLVKEFEGADYDKGTRKQARGEVDKLRTVYGR